MNKKGQKTAEKNVSASFQVLQAPESWSKYTTPRLQAFKIPLENESRVDTPIQIRRNLITLHNHELFS